MQKSDFYYQLPSELIAQTPIINREQSRLLCMDRHTGELAHHHFFELPMLLREGDCLVLNNSRVLPARLAGKLDTGSAVEVVLLNEVSKKIAPTSLRALPIAWTGPAISQQWECLTKPGKKTTPGAKIIFGNGELTAEIKAITNSGNRVIEFKYEGKFLEVLERLGKMPLPPYIKENLEDAERYQTVYASQVGSAAAPTAGLHFTQDLLNKIELMGVKINYVTLHVGLGTFRPVKTDRIEDHTMHSEYFIIPEQTAKAVNDTKKSSGRIIAVGTTSCRVLESCSDEDGKISAFSGFTDIFIYPGYNFKCINGLITNFHLPESTLIMLVSAFSTRKNTLNAYKEAILKRYTFYSFGDAMLII